MFGYVTVNKPELKFKEFDVYQFYYCGLCRELKEKHGVMGQLTLTYDMTFLVLLLTGLYEPETDAKECRCAAHPLTKHPCGRNEFTAYAADMNILLTYYKCMDDWKDERKHLKYLYAAALSRGEKRSARRYAQKAGVIRQMLQKLDAAEQEGARRGSRGASDRQTEEEELDRMAGYFGKITEEIFVYKKDEWEESLRRTGFFLGKFIYLIDAYVDLEKDRKKGCYNPFEGLCVYPDFERQAERILTMMMAECCRSFERLPILENISILRNILYGGVWSRYEAAKAERMAAASGGETARPDEKRTGAAGK